VPVGEDELHYLDATAPAGLIGTRQVSAVEVMRAHLDRIAAVNPEVNAMVTVLAEEGLAAAGAEGQGAGGRWRVGPAARAAGGIPLAKTSLPEFSYWTETDNLLVGRARNPWDGERTPGGSSGGESAAIAAGMSPLGLGSDVAISVRGPAHDTGIVALKATRGRIPITGHWPQVPRRYWHVGPMARSVRDIAAASISSAGPTASTGTSATHRRTAKARRTWPGCGRTGRASPRSARWTARWSLLSPPPPRHCGSWGAWSRPPHPPGWRRSTRPR
jgi:aspartyl-tRNA(Asn)/glutamyl-tRNA(Gln) amidotransferase subunit A